MCRMLYANAKKKFRNEKDLKYDRTNRFIYSQFILRDQLEHTFPIKEAIGLHKPFFARRSNAGKFLMKVVFHPLVVKFQTGKFSLMPFETGNSFFNLNWLWWNRILNPATNIQIIIAIY